MGGRRLEPPPLCCLPPRLSPLPRGAVGSARDIAEKTSLTGRGPLAPPPRVVLPPGAVPAPGVGGGKGGAAALPAPSAPSH